MEEKDSASIELIRLGDENYREGNLLPALDCYLEYIEKNPNDANVHNLIGYLYKKISAYKDLDKQIYHFEKAIEINPDFELAVRNLIFANLRAGNYNEALKYFGKLFQMNPIADDYTSYACLMLRLGDFEQGWKYYGFRFHKKFDRTVYPKIDKPFWEGQDLNGKILLVHHEQGYGDSIQFFRYLNQLKPIARKVIFRVQDGLVDLLKTSDNEIEIVGESTSIETLDFDYHTPLLNLPHLLKAQKDTIPLSNGYIKTDEKKVEKYKKEFFNNDSLKIGISWKGAVGGNERRDVPLKCFNALTKIKNVKPGNVKPRKIKIYSFQKDFHPSEFENLPPEFEIVNLAPTFNDFSDTAAAMANLDYFVTCDNSVFNLAGAMGVKTCVLLSKDAEWRWFLDDETTPWYDSVKIFKKRDENENWAFQMDRIVSHLGYI